MPPSPTTVVAAGVAVTAGTVAATAARAAPLLLWGGNLLFEALCRERSLSIALRAFLVLFLGRAIVVILFLCLCDELLLLLPLLEEDFTHIPCALFWDERQQMHPGGLWLSWRDQAPTDPTSPPTCLSESRPSLSDGSSQSLLDPRARAQHGA